MKKLFISIACTLASLLMFGQAPNLMNYQGVARNAVGNVLPNQPIGLRLTIASTAGGAALYSETRTVTTNLFGLFNVVIGSAGATNIVGTIGAVNWAASGNKFLTVEIDPAGGSNFTNVGSTQLVSVPFSIVAGGAPPIGPAGGDLLGSTYPNPVIAPLMITTGKMADAAVTTVKLADGAVTSQKITFPLVKIQTDAGALIDMTNSGTGPGISSSNTGTGPAGIFTVNNAAGTADALRASTNGTGASWALRATSTGSNGAGLFIVNAASNAGNALFSTTNGIGRAGFFTITNAANSANALEANTNGTAFAFRAASTNALPKALQTVGGLQFTGIGEAANMVLTSDAAGNASWLPVGSAGAITGSGTLNFIPKWTPGTTVLGNSLLFDNGSSMGIGTTTPSHRLTISHSGSTGLGVTSTSGFSTIDIDAYSGDAALRFGKNGVNQWNIRNRPGDDYLEIFELGGGGSRFVIQDGTGNVGIGETNNPAYRLDVLHDGSTGIRSRSTNSFSVVDIDAASGDAALRFQKAGVNQWNTRNRPADDYYEIFELGGGGSRFVIQDGTGNVGIGETTSPSYKLDVLHGGSTGIRSRSSSSFSVVDIDAASGDAALRFAKAGVNQWNTRNRPADDYYEIFELGGGGSRFVIQDATGNVGIGETTNPTYKLDVLHGGSTGIRSRSSSSFSVVDIDGATGDAALRFQKAGVNMWNTRNNPATDDYQIFELGGGGERFRIDNGTGNINIGADLNVGGTLTKGAGAFKIDHPLDPENKYLVHSFVESPDMMNIYNGNISTDASGKAIVQLPDYFEALNMDFRYQLTVIGNFAQAVISREINNNQFEIATDHPAVKVSWQVTGVRHDAYANLNRIPNSVEKEAKNKGKYLHPLAYNKPLSNGINYSINEAGLSSTSDQVLQTAKVKNAPPLTGGSLDQPSITPVAAKPLDNAGSVEDVKKAPAPVKNTDNSGSVAPVENKAKGGRL